MSSTLLTEQSLRQWLTDFRPRRFLANAHLQTLAGNFLRRDITLPQPQRMLVEVEGPVAGYGSTLVACDCHWQPEEVRKQRLTMVLVHGLEGSSNSRYVLGNTARALAAGCNVVRMNMRSCGGTDEISPTIYHSGRSEDVAAVVRAIVEQHQLESIALVGYSMGGNLVLKYLGEAADGSVPQVKAAVGVSPLMDLAVSSAALHEPQNRIYEWHFLRSMTGRLRRKAAMYPRLYADAAIDKIKTMRDFDQHIVARYGNFADADDYYYSVASSQYAASFHVPTLIIHSLDDPFIRMLPETRMALETNPAVTLIETQKGGHCAFLASGANDDGRWAETTLLGYLLEHASGS
ncbi:YheT family hydrolase [Silvibacterium acidisoli]|uniref:YheT family hydrolase n=1 Tax=Acidobacteriaceae bacterium ZG23-2 TaxID=2883246 RepID=UPI00406C5732